MLATCSSPAFRSLSQLLAAIQLFGANLDDYLHLLLPPIVKLFDAPEVPLPSRKYAPALRDYPSLTMVKPSEFC